MYRIAGGKFTHITVAYNSFTYTGADGVVIERGIPTDRGRASGARASWVGLGQSAEMWTRGPARLAAFATLAAALLVAAPPALAAPGCGAGAATAARVGKPSDAVAWRAGILRRAPLWRSVPQGSDKRRRGAIHPRDASWLLVLGAARDRHGRCWLRVRLPSRPNHAAAWLFAGPRRAAPDALAHRRQPQRPVAVRVPRGRPAPALPRRRRSAVDPHPARALLDRRRLALEPGRLPRLLHPPDHRPQQRAAGVRRR